MKITTKIFGNTDPGRVRTNNEDTFICTYVWDDRHILCAAIDGVGGYEGGEVAAEIARQTITEYVDNAQGNRFLEIIKQAVAEANNEIIRRKDDDPKLSMMGCVTSAAIIDLDNRCINIAHVGDSRIYCYHDGELKKISHDHSLVGCLEEKGDLTEAEAMSHPQRNLIDRLLGDKLHSASDRNFIEASISAIPEGDSQYLFCSDGLSDMLTSAQIADVLGSGMTPESEVEQLIADANTAGGKDNVTVVIASIHVQATTPAPAPVPEPAGDVTPTADITAEKAVGKPVAVIDNTSGETTQQDTAPADNPSKPSKRRRWLWILLLILALGIAFGLGGKYIINYISGQAAVTAVPAEPVKRDTVYVVNVENSLDDRKTVDSLQSEINKLEQQKRDNDSIDRRIQELKNELDQHSSYHE